MVYRILARHPGSNPHPCTGSHDQWTNRGSLKAFLNKTFQAGKGSSTPPVKLEVRCFDSCQDPSGCRVAFGSWNHRASTTVTTGPSLSLACASFLHPPSSAAKVCTVALGLSYLHLENYFQLFVSVHTCEITDFKDNDNFVNAAHILFVFLV